MRELAICAALLLSACAGDGSAGESKGRTKVLSKTDLTTYTSVYLIELDGQRYVVVNGTDKVAVCPATR